MTMFFHGDVNIATDDKSPATGSSFSEVAFNNDLGLSFVYNLAVFRAILQVFSAQWPHPNRCIFKGLYSKLCLQV
jgi:hypothetical protein